MRVALDVCYHDILSSNVCCSYETGAHSLHFFFPPLNNGNMQDLSFHAPSADAAWQTHGKTSVFCLRAGVSRGGGEVSPVGLFVICTTDTFFVHTRLLCVCVRRERGRAGLSLCLLFSGLVFFFHRWLSCDSLTHKEQLLHFTFTLL